MGNSTAQYLLLLVALGLLIEGVVCGYPIVPNLFLPTVLLPAKASGITTTLQGNITFLNAATGAIVTGVYNATTSWQQVYSPIAPRDKKIFNQVPF